MPENDTAAPRVVYIAGPMTGLPDFNYPAFHDAGFELALRGYEVLNPVVIENWNTLGRPQEWDWYMRHSIAMVLRAEAIALLPGWESSRGARLEHEIGVQLGLAIRTLAVGGRMSLYYQDEFVQLHHGNYRDVLPGLAPVDHVISDPPYSEKTHSNVRSRRMAANDRGGRYGADLRRQVDLGFDHITPEDMHFLAVEFARLSKRWVLVFSDVESDHLWRSELTHAGLDYVRTGAWVKRGSTPQFSGDRPATAFEAITICHPSGRKRWNGGGKHALWDVPIVLNRARADKSERVHPTQKPELLMRHLVADFTDPGDVILDATAGSGTTGVAAKVEGRRAVLIERDEKHCESAAKRLAAVQQTFDFGSLEVPA